MSSVGDSRRGTTLMELVVVLAIIGVVAGIAAPVLFRPAPDDQAILEAELTTLLARARETALERGERVTVTIDADNARFWVEARGTLGTTALQNGALSLVPNTRSEQASIPRATFSFDPDGRASGEAFSLSANGTTVLVSVDPWTGVPSAATR